MQRPPLKVNPNFYNLTTQAQIPPELINFSSIGLESDRYLTVCEYKPDGSGNLTSVDLRNFEQSKRPNKAEAVMQHPQKNWTVVRAKGQDGQSTVIHLYNMDTKEKVLSSTIADVVKYWTWLNDKLIGIVCSKSVYNINIEASKESGATVNAEKVFDREKELGGTNPVQIINYSADSLGKFGAIAGLSKKEDGSVGGNIQLTSLQLGKSQFLEGYYCCFGKSKVHDEFTDTVLFAYVQKTKLTGKVTVSEIGTVPEGKTKFKKEIDIVFPDGNESDFPVYMTFNNQLGLIFVFSKMGLLFLFEVSEGSLILRSKVSESVALTGCGTAKGCLLLNKSGNLINIEADESALADFVKNSPHIKGNIEIARKISIRAGLPGSDNLFLEQFNKLFQAGSYDDAARIVSSSPGTVLRNKDTIEKFRQLPKPESGPHPILKFFFVLLEAGKLNQIESKEICQLVLNQNKPQMVGRWLDENKLHCSEELGDIVRGFDLKLAERIYSSCGSSKVMQVKLELGVDVESVIGNGKPEELLAQVRSLSLTDPAAALNLAKALAKTGKVAPQQVTDIFFKANQINELTSFSLDFLPNTADNGNWQTVILEFNLKNSPSVAETIFQTGRWTFYNRARVAPLCEQKGLFLRALENYSDLKDIKRILLNHFMNIPAEYLKNYIVGSLPPEHIPSVISDLLKYSRNVKLMVEVCHLAYNKTGVKELVDVFESQNAWEGVYFFLGPLLENSKDSKVYLKYIEACIKVNQLPEVEKILQNFVGYYDPQKVLDLLLASKLSDPKALVILCDKNNYIKEMTRYLWENNFLVYIEMYVIRINPSNAGEVLGCLIDLGAEEKYLRQLLNTLGASCPVETLVKEFHARAKLSLLDTWLEQRIAEGNSSKEVHNSMAKMLIDSDKTAAAEKFLSEDKFYDVKEIGDYLQGRDEHMALTVYRRDMGSCDQEILDLTNKNGLYRFQAKYLVERQNDKLWTQVLDPKNPHRAQVVEQVVSSALPESKVVEEVSSAVQAFVQAEMPEELLGLLEKIVLHSNEFANYKKLQNLLIITAIRTDKSRVMDYINRLDNYEGLEVAKVALQPEYKLYEEAFTIYKKIKKPVEAINVLLKNIGTMERASEFAERNNLPEVWTVLGKAYLEREQLVEAIDAFIHAKDPSCFEEIISLNRKNPKFEKLIDYFEMARSIKKEIAIDNEYIYALAKLNKINEISNFITNTTADLSKTADRLFSEKLYEAAKILYTKLKSNSKIASCLVHLGEFQQAIEFAKKASNIKTWKEIVHACVEVKEFKLAAQAATNVVTIPDHLEEMVKFYETYDASEEMITLLEQLVAQEKANQGIFTELAILYAKYNEQKLSDFVKAYFTKLNVLKVTKACRKYELWKEVVYLHSNYKEYDSAVKEMMDHSPSCFQHDQFVNNLLKVANADLIYKALSFYLEEEPLRLNELLKQITPKVDFSKVVSQIKRSGNLPLIVDWLKSVQSQNNQSVNDALNQIYLEMEDYESLRHSILTYDSIDAIGLAKQIEGNSNTEFRRISALIYRKNKKFKESIEIAVSDNNFRDAIESAQESGSSEIVEQLLLFFAQNGHRDFFAVTTYTCYEQLQPDFVLEISWRYGLTDFAMPFMIQLVKELSSRVETVQRQHDEREKKEEEKQERDARRPLDIGGFINPSPLSSIGLTNNVPMLMNNPSSGPTLGNFGGFPSQTPTQPTGFGTLGGLGNNPNTFQPFKQRQLKNIYI